MITFFVVLLLGSAFVLFVASLLECWTYYQAEIRARDARRTQEILNEINREQRER